MNETKKTNARENKNGGVSNAAAYAGVGIGSAGVGFAASAAARHISEDHEEELAQNDLPVEEPVDEALHETEKAMPEADIHYEEHHYHTTIQTPTEHHATVNVNMAHAGHHSEDVEIEPIVEEIEVAETTDGDVDDAFEGESPALQPVDPEGVANAIISGEEIDPSDIKTEDIVNFEEIGTVYAVNGDEMTAASFHTPDGNEYVMVDIDGDNVFDVVTDTEGNGMVDNSGHLVTAHGMTVTDAEMGIAPNDTYLAADDNDHTTDYGADSIAEDVIS